MHRRQEIQSSTNSIKLMCHFYTCTLDFIMYWWHPSSGDKGPLRPGLVWKLPLFIFFNWVPDFRLPCNPQKHCLISFLDVCLLSCFSVFTEICLRKTELMVLVSVISSSPLHVIVFVNVITNNISGLLRNIHLLLWTWCFTTLKAIHFILRTPFIEFHVNLNFRVSITICRSCHKYITVV